MATPTPTEADRTAAEAIAGMAGERFAWEIRDAVLRELARARSEGADESHAAGGRARFARCKLDLARALGLPVVDGGDLPEWAALLDDVRGRSEKADDLPRHLRIALANATRAFERGDLRGLATINEDLQPLVDAAVAWGRRMVKGCLEVEAKAAGDADVSLRADYARQLGILDPADTTPCWADIIEAARADGVRRAVLVNGSTKATDPTTVALVRALGAAIPVLVAEVWRAEQSDGTTVAVGRRVEEAKRQLRDARAALGMSELAPSEPAALDAG